MTNASNDLIKARFERDSKNAYHTLNPSFVIFKRTTYVPWGETVTYFVNLKNDPPWLGEFDELEIVE